VFPEEFFRDDIHPFIRALGGKYGGDEQFQRIRVTEGTPGIWVSLVEVVQDLLNAILLSCVSGFLFRCHGRAIICLSRLLNLKELAFDFWCERVISQGLLIKGESYMSEETSAGEKILYVMLGAMIGAAAALLLAPRTGEETRRLIVTKAREGADIVSNRTKAVAGKTSDLLQQQRDQLAAALEAGKQAYREEKEKA